MASGDNREQFEKIRKLAEENLRKIFEDAMANAPMREAVGRAGKMFAKNRATLDRGIEAILDFAGIPSKRDVRELRARIDQLSAHLLNINLKLDRLADSAARPPRAKRKPRGSSNGAK